MTRFAAGLLSPRTAVAATLLLLAAGTSASVSPPPASWPIGRPASGLPLYPPGCTLSGCHTGTTNATDRLGKVGNGANNPAKINNAILNGKMTNATLRAMTAQQISDIAAYLGNPAAASTPVASAAPQSITFAPTAVGATSPAQTVTLANGGTAALGPIAVAASGAFVVTAGTCNAGGTVAAGSSCTVAVSFRPTAIGAASGTLTLSHNATPATTVIALAGTGVAAAAPNAAAVPGALAFATTLVGATSAVQSATLANTGNAPLLLGAIAASNGFVVTGGGTCVVGMAIAPGTTCSATVAFAPTVAGVATGTLTFSHNASPSTSVVALSGSASLPTPVASVTPPALAFSQVTGTVSSPQTARIANAGSAPLAIASVAISGAQASEFAVVSNGCGSAIAPGASCAVTIAFAPAANGARTASLVVAHNAAGSPSTVALNGSGNATPQPVVWVSNNAIDLGSQPLGSSATGSVTVTNSGQAPLVVSSLGFSGTGAFDYTSVGTCAAALSVAVGQSCTLAVRFAPTALGARPASVVLASNAAPVTVGLTGIGTAVAAPAIALAPGAQDFGVAAVTGAPVSRTITLTNTGSAQLNIAAIGVTGAGFAATNTCGSSVAAGASCTIVVTFTPVGATTSTGQLTVTSNAVPATATVALSGTGSLATLPVLAWTGTATFADTAVGATSDPAALTLVNQGPGASTLTSLGASTAEFVVGGACAPGTVLASGSSCAVTVAFAPAGAGPRAATLNVVASGSVPAPLALRGNGWIAAQQALAVTPASLDFPALSAGAPVDPVPVTVSNSGTTPIRVVALRFATGVFVATPRCGALPFALAPGENCLVDVAPDPASAATPGDLVDTLTVVTDTPGMSRALSIVASVAAPAVEMTNVGAGGCSLAAPANVHRDPTLWLLAGAALAVLATRRRERRRTIRPASAARDRCRPFHRSTGEHR